MNNVQLQDNHPFRFSGVRNLTYSEPQKVIKLKFFREQLSAISKSNFDRVFDNVFAWIIQNSSKTNLKSVRYERKKPSRIKNKKKKTTNSEEKVKVGRRRGGRKAVLQDEFEGCNCFGCGNRNGD